MKANDSTVLLSNGTVGTLMADSIDYADPQHFIGEHVSVHLHDENGNSIVVAGEMIEVLS